MLDMVPTGRTRTRLDRCLNRDAPRVAEAMAGPSRPRDATDFVGVGAPAERAMPSAPPEPAPGRAPTGNVVSKGAHPHSQRLWCSRISALGGRRSGLP